MSPIKAGGDSQGEKHTGGDPKSMTRSVSDIKITHFPVTSLNYFEYLDRRYTAGSKNLLVLTCLRSVNLHLEHINPLSADRLLELTPVVTLRWKKSGLNDHNSDAYVSTRSGRGQGYTLLSPLCNLCYKHVNLVQIRWIDFPQPSGTEPIEDAWIGPFKT